MLTFLPSYIHEIDDYPTANIVLLSKGFEIEIYTGTHQGDIIGLSDRIVRDLDGFVREPDRRNVEYTTAPLCCYDRLLCALLRPRRTLRHYLKTLGNYTLIPGSTLALGGSDHFERSDPYNPYHTYIEQTYGTDVVTASVHINIGIDHPDTLMRACRLIRVEAPLYLALSAASPFLKGKPTGYHSTRWQVFPQTPRTVPLFESHAHFIRWTEAQLAAGTMQNVRHLWTSVRPNGDHRPYNLNRLELRICDLVADPLRLLAITALLEARLIQLLEDPHLDPLEQSQLPAMTREQDLLSLTASNEAAAAQSSLEATLHHWQTGHAITCLDWVQQLYQSVYPIAKRRGFSCFLSPLQSLLQQGNSAQQWLKHYEHEREVRSVIVKAHQALARQEQQLEDKLCQPLLVA